MFPRFNSQSFIRWLLGILIIGLVGCMALPTGQAQSPVQTAPVALQPLSPDDVSWLFPAPMRIADLDKLISMGDLTAPNPQDPTKRDPVWSDTVFQRFLGITASDRAQVSGTQVRIGLPAETQSIRNWFVAGIRIDPGAPGLSDNIRAQFGQSPQIRLIVQPVRRNSDGSTQAIDVAAHLIFDFTLPGSASAQTGCSPLLVPDPTALSAIVADASALRTRLANGEFGNKIITSSLPLGVHPGLIDPTADANVAGEMKAFLERHISAAHLNAMTVMGTPASAPEPWIFLAMANVSQLGGFIPVPGPTLDGQQSAQMLELAAGFRVTPVPNTNNLNVVTCKNAAVPTANIPMSDRLGVATSELFLSPRPSDQRINDVLDRIANPTQSHFFNTDCVSCHTDTQRAIALLHTTTTPGVDHSAFQAGDWNVRNFGWGPGGRPTATRRTAAETAAVVAFINSQMLNK